LRTSCRRFDRLQNRRVHQRRSIMDIMGEYLQIRQPSGRPPRPKGPARAAADWQWSTVPVGCPRLACGDRWAGCVTLRELSAEAELLHDGPARCGLVRAAPEDRRRRSRDLGASESRRLVHWPGRSGLN
jgi:hypothetical protein